jgi:hypothetical protein
MARQRKKPKLDMPMTAIFRIIKTFAGLPVIRFASLTGNWPTGKLANVVHPTKNVSLAYL